MSAVPVSRFAPDFQLRIRGKNLPVEAALDLVSLTVEDDVDAAGMFSFQMVNQDSGKNTVKWSDNAMFDEGGEVIVSMRYGNQLVPLMTCDITGIEPEFRANGASLLTVRGFDRRHRLLRARRTRSFTQVKDSDVASQLAQDAGLTANVTDSGVVHEYLFQNGQSDLEFLQRRARSIGFEVAVQDKTLYFRPRQIAQSETLSLSMDNDVLEFHPRSSVVTQFSSVGARGWDPTQKDSIASQSAAGDELAVMGDVTGPAVAQKAFGGAPMPIADWPVRTLGEAEALTRGVYNEMALDYITGEGICVGRPELRAGIVIRLSGFGKRFSGLYYVTATTHSWTALRGYRTAFTVRRNAS